MEPVEQRFELRDFATESGVVLPGATVVYGTWGTLNAAGDNAVLLPSHYMADLHGYDWLIGPDGVDPGELFLVATELFGNGRSSSPSTTAAPFHGPRFPVTTIRDNVAAVHRLLTEQLGVTRLRAVVGFSMGAMQAFQWAVSHPGFVGAIVASCGTARCHPHGVVRLEGQIAALSADPTFQGGDYDAPPAVGISAFGMVWAAWLYSQQWWREERWREDDADATFESVLEEFRTAFVPGADANDLLLQCRTWQAHGVGGTPPFAGDLPAALASIRCPVLYLPGETDLYFPVEDARAEAAHIPDVVLAPIPSDWGHTAGCGPNPADTAFVTEAVVRFLSDLSPNDRVREQPRIETAS